MILRILFLMFLFISSLLSDSFNFSEVRYSDALERSIKLKGEITFEKNSLHIKYNDSERSILYKDSVLTLKENDRTVELEEAELQRVSQFFEILLLLHSGDESALNDKFDMQRFEDKSMLIPKGYIGNFVQKIELKKLNKELKEVSLFLKNSDYITISIEDEIR
ncbi:MAG: hypothetical protein ABFQ64_00150 [Campylobacterota bacterium]